MMLMIRVMLAALLAAAQAAPAPFPNLKVTGRVVDHRGQPVEGATVEVRAESEVASVVLATGSTGPDGRFEIWLTMRSQERRPVWVVAAGNNVSGASRSARPRGSSLDVGDVMLLYQTTFLYYTQ